MIQASDNWRSGEMRALPLLPAVILATSPAVAENWTWVGVTDKREPVHYDRDSIQRSGDTVTVWTRATHRLNEDNDDRETRLLNRYDCGVRTVVTLSYRIEDEARVLRTGATPQAQRLPDRIAPGTIDDRIFGEVCR